MNSTHLSSLFVLFTVLLQAVPSFSSIFFTSEALKSRFCPRIYDDFDTCSTAPSEKLYYLHDQYPNITSPLIAIETSDNLSGFNVKFKNGTAIEKVSAFTMLAEEEEVDIELMDTSNDIVVECVSFGSFSRITTNIIVPDRPMSIQSYSNRTYAELKTHSVLTLSKGQLQSGRFTCHSVGQKHAETFKIFTQPSASDDTNPFVTNPDSPTEQIEKRGDGYIVPCRTNRRLNRDPELRWKTHEKDITTTWLNPEEKNGSFRWDPSVGFQFNSSDDLTEMGYFECHFGNFKASVVPTPEHFENSVVVVKQKAEISCAVAARNSSKLFPAVTNYQKAGYYECSTYFKCDLALESGVHLQKKTQTEVETTRRQILDLNNTSGIVSCFCDHIHNGNIVPEISSRIFFVGLDSNVYFVPGAYPDSSVIKISQVDDPLYKETAELYNDFTCTTVNFMAYQEVRLIIRYHDLTETSTTLASTPDPDALYSETRFPKVLFQGNMTHAICVCLTQDGREVRAEMETIAPVIDNKTTGSRTFKVGDMHESLTCPITGAPSPTYRWTFAEKNKNLVQGQNTRTIKFHHIQEKLTGNYTCEARNKFGNKSFSFQVSVRGSDVASKLNTTVTKSEVTLSAKSSSKAACDFTAMKSLSFFAVVTLIHYFGVPALKL